MGEMYYNIKKEKRGRKKEGIRLMKEREINKKKNIQIRFFLRDFRL